MSELISTFGINWQLLLAQAINFGVLLLALWWFLYRPLTRMIDERRVKISEGVKAADEAEKKLSESLVERDGMLSAAAKEGEAMIVKARSSASLRADELIDEAGIRAENIVKDAAMRAEETARQALKESEKDIARAAMLAAEKILREKQ